MSQIHIAAYSMGHFCNDLMVAMWFVYLAWYLQKVVHLDQHTTGLCLLSGQISGGIATLVVGLASDKCDSRCGKRWPWFLVGTILSIPSFLGIFSFPVFINKMPLDEDLRKTWYITLPALFNIGWSFVQISHLSIVNTLSLSNRRRDQMINTKNAFTYAANIFILSLALALFAIYNVDAGDDNIREVAILEFRLMTFIGLGIGIITSLFYIVVIREASLTRLAIHYNDKYLNTTGYRQGSSIASATDSKETQGKDWKAWLKEGNFYIHGFVYVSVMMARNITMAIQPFYLQLVMGYGLNEKLKLDKDGVCIDQAHIPASDPTPKELALVPLVSYLTSLLFSLFV